MAIAILAAAVAGLASVPAFGQQLPCPGCIEAGGQDPRITAMQSIQGALPISVDTDRTNYGHDDVIQVSGKVGGLRPGTDIALTVTGPPPFNNIVKIDQISVRNDGTFSTSLTTGGELWKYDGTYTIKVTYGAQEIFDRAYVQLSGGVTGVGTVECASGEFPASGQCVPYSITGGTVSSAMFSSADKSLTININSMNDGMITVNPSTSAISGIFMVLVDGEEWDDVEITGNTVSVSFPAGTEKIEIIGTFAIPEFGTIAALILAVAIISIIAVTAKTRLNVLPKY